jgi:hypothetical protein
MAAASVACALAGPLVGASFILLRGRWLHARGAEILDVLGWVLIFGLPLGGVLLGYLAVKRGDERDGTIAMCLSAGAFLVLMTLLYAFSFAVVFWQGAREW